MLPTSFSIASVRTTLERRDVDRHFVRRSARYARPAGPAAPAPVPGLVSVITVCLNGAALLAGAMRSVQGQDYPSVEYIVVDGGSTDASLAMLAAADGVDCAISLPDSGIAEAFNRGVALATGEFVAFHNVDDLWPSDHLSICVAALRAHADCDFVYGDLIRVDTDNDEMYTVRGEQDLVRKLHGWPPEFNHPSFLTRYSTFARHGVFDQAYRVCMDLEWLMRITGRGARGVYAEQNWVLMRCGGISDNPDRMFKDVFAILLASGGGKMKARALYGRARIKLWLKRAIHRLFGQRMIARIRRMINPQIDAPHDARIAGALALLRH